MSEQQQVVPTPQQKTEAFAAAVIEQNNIYVKAVADTVIGHLDSTPEQVAGIVFRKLEQRGTHNTMLVRFKLGEPIEINQKVLLELFTFTTWVGGAVRVALLIIFMVLVGLFCLEWLLPDQSSPTHQTQEVKK